MIVFIAVNKNRIKNRSIIIIAAIAQWATLPFTYLQFQCFALLCNWHVCYQLYSGMRLEDHVFYYIIELARSASRFAVLLVCCPININSVYIELYCYSAPKIHCPNGIYQFRSIIQNFISCANVTLKLCWATTTTTAFVLQAPYKFNSLHC